MYKYNYLVPDIDTFDDIVYMINNIKSPLIFLISDIDMEEFFRKRLIMDFPNLDTSHVSFKISNLVEKIPVNRFLKNSNDYNVFKLHTNDEWSVSLIPTIIDPFYIAFAEKQNKLSYGATLIKTHKPFLPNDILKIILNKKESIYL